MKAVKPIKSKELVEDISDYLKEQSDRNYMLFMFGIYSGLRISDILKLRVRDVKGKDYISCIEKKTGKERQIPINQVLKKEIARYVKDKKDYHVLFKSRQGGNNKAITRQQAYNIISSAARKIGMNERIGTHTMRKTFGYNLYKKTHDIVLVQQILNHSTPEYTLTYIGITQETMDDAILGLRY